LLLSSVSVAPGLTTVPDEASAEPAPARVTVPASTTVLPV
jgi:hypothetical protein